MVGSPLRTPTQAMSDFIVPRTCYAYVDDSLEVERVLKNRSNESQLFLVRVKRKRFLFIWAKSNCD